jgi:hypothetical protein
MGVATREGHWPEAIDLLRHVPDDEYFRLIELVSKERKETLDAMVAATATDNLWEVVTPALARMENPSRAFDALLRADDAAIRGFADAVIIEDDWSDMHLLLEKLSKKQLELLHTRLRENDRAEQFAPVEELFVA